jgi:hypothetical protein
MSTRGVCPTPGARFLVSVGVGREPARGRTGGRRRWPPRAVPGRGRGSTGPARGAVAALGSQGGARAAWSRSAWLLASPRRTPMVGTGGAQERGRSLARDAKGQRPLYRRHACLPATDGPTATSLGVCAGLNRSAQQGKGVEPTGGPRSGARPASEGSPRGVWELQGRPWGARCLGKARGLGRRTARTPRRRYGARRARADKGGATSRSSATRCGVA